QPLSIGGDLLGMGLLGSLQCGDIFLCLVQFGLNGGDTLGDCCKVLGQLGELILPALNKCSPLHNKLFPVVNLAAKVGHLLGKLGDFLAARLTTDRKSTRLNSSHVSISYAVFCLKKKT